MGAPLTPLGRKPLTSPLRSPPGKPAPPSCDWRKAGAVSCPSDQVRRRWDPGEPLSPHPHPLLSSPAPCPPQPPNLSPPVSHPHLSWVRACLAPSPAPNPLDMPPPFTLPAHVWLLLGLRGCCQRGVALVHPLQEALQALGPRWEGAGRWVGSEERQQAWGAGAYGSGVRGTVGVWWGAGGWGTGVRSTGGLGGCQAGVKGTS